MSPQEIQDKILPAVLQAPSAHNTQPWSFKVSENTLELFVDAKRHLTVSDPTRRELFVSLGCAIENAVIAAAHAGQQAVVTLFPEGESETAPVARIQFSSEASGSQDELFSAIQSRRTDRSVYDAQRLTPQERGQLTTLNDPSIMSVEDREKINTVADVTEQGTVATLSRKDFKEELAHWVRSDWTSKPDGMPGYAMGMPAPLSLVSSVMVRVAPIHKQEGPKTRQQMASVALVAVIVTPSDSPQEWLKAGQLLERLWLEITVAGLAAAPLASAIEASGEIRRQLQNVLGTQRLPQVVLRVGHSSRKNLRASPRRTIKDCLRQ